MAAATARARPIRLNVPSVNAVMALVYGHLYANYSVTDSLGAETTERAERYELTVQVARTRADKDLTEATRLFQDASFTGTWLMLRPWIELVLMELERDLTAMVGKRRWPGHVISLVSRHMRRVHERVAAVADIMAVPGASPAPRILPHPLQALLKDLATQLIIAPLADVPASDQAPQPPVPANA